MSREDQRLESVPGMGGAFARALVPSRRTDAHIPSQRAVVHGVRQDRERLVDYARVCGFTLRDAVPPTWLHVLTFPLHVHLLGDRASSVRLVGAVHVSNSMTLHRPVVADETLELAVYVDDLRPHRRGALVDLVGEVSVDGEAVWSGVSTYLSQSVSVPGEPVEVARTPWEPTPPHARWRLPSNLGREYRRVSHDPNPIHANRLAAKAFGFPRPIIHGTWTHARALAALEGRLPATYTANVEFVKPVFLPGTVGFSSDDVGGALTAAVTTKDGAKPHMMMRVEGSLPE